MDGDGEEEPYASFEEEPSDEDILCFFLESNDEDAVFITEFEDQMIEAIQESELAPVYATYQGARQRLRDKAKSRGFWPTTKGRGKSKGGARKGKGAQFAASSWGNGRNRTLADRIANSSCRLCGARGHWKKECPRRANLEARDDAKTEAMHYTQEAMPIDEPYLPKILHTTPDEAMTVDSDEDGIVPSTAEPACQDRILIKPLEAICYMAAASLRDTSRSWSEVLARKLLMLARKHRKCTPTTGMRSDHQPRTEAEPAVLQSAKSLGKADEVALVATEGAEGVLDTGASRTVVEQSG